MQQQDFTRDFCKLVQKTSLIDLNVYGDRPVVIDSPNFIKRQCDFFPLYEYYEDLMNGLTSVLVRLYITKVKITISEECGIINAIYNQAVLLMYKFWDQNVLFFFEMLDIILPKDYGTECFVVKNKYFSEVQLNEKNETHNG